MTERPDFIDSTDPQRPGQPQESVFSQGGQDPSSQGARPPVDENEMPATILAPRQDPSGDHAPSVPPVPPARQAPGAGYAEPPAQPRTAQPFPGASNYVTPTQPGQQPSMPYSAPSAPQPAAGPYSAPSAPQGNYWQPQQAVSTDFQTAQGYPYGQPGYAAQPQNLPAVPTPAASGPYYDLGPILIRGDQVITPTGTIPLSMAQFTFQDMSQTTKRTPTWAIVVAIVLCWFFLLSLLLLIIQEEQTTGQVIVSVTGGEGAYYLTVPVSSQSQVYAWAQQVQQAQVIASQARM
ncbi:hypothetical protein PROPJV5_2177 [Propionibacterium ruminifibrarum]|uniref:Uncharacterized protein n=1 Tax=Propionibacterium ruminifibrarum TaxID=1962131 RepID=A0A375I302_9ACTN|nr:hypothetical protein [Propionibacterium ruminifibrarum]SPF69216.1 hypothetical protein PROPJV5_2177 [Propionibacterium ruminifibrarum]